MTQSAGSLTYEFRIDPDSITRSLAEINRRFASQSISFEAEFDASTVLREFNRIQSEIPDISFSSVDPDIDANAFNELFASFDPARIDAELAAIQRRIAEISAQRIELEFDADRDRVLDRIQAEITQLSQQEVNLNFRAANANAGIARIDDQIRRINDRLLVLRADPDAAISQINRLEAQVDSLDAKRVKLEADGAGFRSELEDLQERLNGLRDAEINVDANVNEAVRGLERLDNELVSLQNEARELQSAFRGFSTETQAAIGVFSTGLAAGIGKIFVDGIQQASEFETSLSTLTNAFGDAAQASSELERIESFAADTPFQVDALTQSFINLVNRGFTPTNTELTKLGDLAASQGRSFDQLVEAVLDAQTGENERLKEFGITAETTADQVTFAFRGIEQSVERTPEAIREALLSFGELDGVAGSLAAQSDTLAGRFSNLEDATTQASRSFGEFAAVGARPLVEAAILLVDGFNALPGPIQSALIATTAFAGVLAAAVAAITAYNLANGQLIVSEIAKAAALVQSNALLLAESGATAAATAAKAVYATVTGTATAAQSAFTASLVASGVAIAAFAGAVASIALVANTFTEVTEAARELEAATRGVEDALLEIRQVGSGGSIEVVGEEAALNVQRLEEDLNGLQRALDGFRGFVGLGTAAEAATSRSTVAFGQLTETIGEVEGEAFKLASALQDGVNVDSAQIEATTAAIGESIAALQAAEPVTENEIRLRDAQIERLEAWRESIAQAAAGTDNLTESTADLSARLETLSDDLAASQAALDLQASAQEAEILESVAAGGQSQSQADQSIASVEQASLESRIANARALSAELQEIKAATTDPAEIQQLENEITQVETQVNQDRIALANSQIQAQESAAQESERIAREAAQARQEAEQEALDAIVQANAEAEAAIAQSQSSRQAALLEGQLSGAISAEDAAIAGQEIQIDVSLEGIAAAEQQLAALQAARNEGSISAEVAAEQERQLITEIGQLNVQRLQGELELQAQIRQVEIDRLNESFELQQLAAQQQQSLLSAQTGLQEALGSLDAARLETARLQAELAGDVAGGRQIELQITQQQIQIENQQFASRREMLVIESEIRQLKIEQQLAVARESGASNAILENLESQLRAEERLFDLQSQKISAEEALSQELRTQEDLNNRLAQQQDDITGALESQSEISVRLQAQAEERRRAEESVASTLAGAFQFDGDTVSEQVDSALAQFRLASNAGLDFGGIDFDDTLRDVERAINSGSDRILIQEAVDNADNPLFNELLQQLGRGDIAALVEADQSITEQLAEANQPVVEELQAIRGELTRPNVQAIAITPDSIGDASRLYAQTAQANARLIEA